MLSRKDLILPVIVLILMLTLVFYIFFNFGKDFIFNYQIKNYGLTNSGEVSDKNSEGNYLSIIHEINGRAFNCKIEVNKSTFNAFGVGDQISVTYLKDNPKRCTLPHSVNFNYLLNLSLILSGFFFLIVSSGFGYYIYKSFKKPGDQNPLKLTTDLDLNTENVMCPKCGEKMNEGYLPTVGGVCWRNIDEPVGIPTILSGLPGTTFWVKRPKLHGLHCNQCRIITFKYGRK